jgi:hypothetical protein
VGNGNIDVGNATPTRNSGQSIKEDLTVTDGTEVRIDPSQKRSGRERPAGLCGAMSQQRDEFRANVSAPQKFVHLVGCHDKKLAPRQEAPAYSGAGKR